MAFDQLMNDCLTQNMEIQFMITVVEQQVDNNKITMLCTNVRNDVRLIKRMRKKKQNMNKRN